MKCVMIAVSLVATFCVANPLQAAEVRCFCPTQFYIPLDPNDPYGDWLYQGLYHVFDPDMGEDCDNPEPSLMYDTWNFIYPFPSCVGDVCSCKPKSASGEVACGTEESVEAKKADDTSEAQRKFPNMVLAKKKSAFDGLELPVFPEGFSQIVIHSDFVRGDITIAGKTREVVLKIFLISQSATNELGVQKPGGAVFGRGFEIQLDANQINTLLPNKTNLRAKPALIAPPLGSEDAPEVYPGLVHITVGNVIYAVQIANE